MKPTRIACSDMTKFLWSLADGRGYVLIGAGCLGSPSGQSSRLGRDFPSHAAGRGRWSRSRANAADHFAVRKVTTSALSGAAHSSGSQ